MNEKNENTELVSYLRSTPKNHKSFLQVDVNYYKRYKRIDNYLNNEIHPNVNQGAMRNGDGWLTDHGPEHVTTVIRRAGELVASADPIFLTPYEVYILLIAIHFHDVGNIFGRRRHEQNITEVIQELDQTLIGGDGIEIRMIRDIAMAHGGYADEAKGDKDTIGKLRWQRNPDISQPRVHLLAAILRFADELADDHTRTNRFLIKRSIPRESEVYHMYADRLRKVMIRTNDRRVSLRFELDRSHATREYGKGCRQVYLYDEIVDRSLKMHREHVYCLRFMQPYIYIDSIDIKVEISTNRFMNVVQTLQYSLRQRGYPDRPTSLKELNIDSHIQSLTGQRLHDLLESETE